MIDLGVVVVSHNSESLLPGCLAALHHNSELEVLVVDNNSGDKSVEVAASNKIETIALSTNTGFSFACNTGARALTDCCHWIAFVNPDVIASGGDLLRAVRDAPADVVAISPLVLDPGGRPQADIARPEPSVWWTIARYLFSARADVASRAAARLVQWPNSGARYIDVPVTSGGCLLVRLETFVAVGGFDEAYFLNMEDVDLCCRLRRHGGRLVIDARVRAIHAKGTSSSTATFDQRLFECGRAEVLYFERNRPLWETVLVASSVVAGCIARSALRHARTRSPRGWLSLLSMYSTLIQQATGSVWRALSHARPPACARPAFVSK